MKILAAIAAPLAALILTAPAVAGSGTTWIIPDQGHPTIRHAINDPLVSSGDTLLLAPGDHVGFSFGGKALHIRAIHPDPAQTTITPYATGEPVVTAENGETPASILEGVTIRDGNVTPDPKNPFGGGGIRCLVSSPTFVNCVITANTVQSSFGSVNSVAGGGVYILGGLPSFVGCTISDNTADFLNNFVGEALGGGVYILSSTPIFANCNFTSNLAQSVVDSTSPASWTSKSFGGGVFSKDSAPIFTDCVFQSNISSATAKGFGIGNPGRVATASGGGYSGDGGDPLFANCTFSSNRTRSKASQSDNAQAYSRGGAISQARQGGNVSNCTFTSNRSDNVITSGFNSARGGAVHTARSYSNCCEASGGLGCDDSDCTTFICGSDPFCCDTEWDLICANAAVIGCTVCGPATTTTYSDCTFDSNEVDGGDEDWGGAVFCDADSITSYVNCSFDNHDSAAHGGAMYILSSSPFVISCTMTNNRADRGGAIYNMSANPSITGSTFIDNNTSQGTAFADGGGAIYSTGVSLYAIAGCTFNDNAANAGGAVLNFENFDGANANLVPTIDFSTFDSNVAQGQDGGGGGAVRNFKSSPVFNQCTFTNNHSFASGGSVMNQGQGDEEIGAFADFTSCVFEGNIADENGGAIFNTENLGFPALDECDFVGNSASSGGAIYNDPDSEFIGSSLIVNSMFCENTPMTDAAEESDDLGQIVGFWFDQGNNDFSAECGAISIVCVGDTNGDSQVNVDDLVNVILDFGSNGSLRNGDVNNDNIVDVDDLVIVILAWGMCPQQN